MTNDLFETSHDVETTESTMNTDTLQAPALFGFDHPYPRYGLAVTLDAHRSDWDDLQAVLNEPERLATMAGSCIQEGLTHFRVHTGSPEDAKRWKYRYLTDDELETSGQTASDRYFIAPHVIIDDRSSRYLIREARKMRDTLDAGTIKLSKSAKLKRSFAPFVTKLNEGSATLSNPKASTLESIFSLVAAVTPHKPASQVDFTNQGMIPDLPLPELLSFVQLFRYLKHVETDNLLVLTRREGSNRRRPPLFDGNYPDAPRSSAFGPVGLMAAIGRYRRSFDASSVESVNAVLDALAGATFYLVSYDGGLMRSEKVGHHVARLAKSYDLIRAVEALHRPDFYSPDDRARRSPQRTLFQRMAAHWLQTYNRAAFRDFIAFRTHYDASLSSIFEDYFMTQRAIPRDVVRSARTYGAYLNDAAFRAAQKEVEQNKQSEGGGTGRNIYEAKTRYLAQFESAAMSAKRASALFGQLNVQAGRFSNKDAPAEAETFIEAATVGEDLDFDTAKELVLAFMRLRTDGGDASNDA